MLESNIRRIHGMVGVSLAILILLQVGSGLLLSVSSLVSEAPHDHALPHDSKGALAEIPGPEHEEGVLASVHHRTGWAFDLYRTALGTGIVLMVVSGTTIFIKSQKRKRT